VNKNDDLKSCNYEILSHNYEVKHQNYITDSNVIMSHMRNCLFLFISSSIIEKKCE